MQQTSDTTRHNRFRPAAVATLGVAIALSSTGSAQASSFDDMRDTLLSFLPWWNESTGHLIQMDGTCDGMIQQAQGGCAGGTAQLTMQAQRLLALRPGCSPGQVPRELLSGTGTPAMGGGSPCDVVKDITLPVDPSTPQGKGTTQRIVRTHEGRTLVLEVWSTDGKRHQLETIRCDDLVADDVLDDTLDDTGSDADDSAGDDATGSSGGDTPSDDTTPSSGSEDANNSADDTSGTTNGSGGSTGSPSDDPGQGSGGNYPDDDATTTPTPNPSTSPMTTSPTTSEPNATQTGAPTPSTTAAPPTTTGPGDSGGSNNGESDAGGSGSGNNDEPSTGSGGERGTDVPVPVAYPTTMGPTTPNGTDDADGGVAGVDATATSSADGEGSPSASGTYPGTGSSGTVTDGVDDAGSGNAGSSGGTESTGGDEAADAGYESGGLARTGSELLPLGFLGSALLAGGLALRSRLRRATREKQAL